MASMLHENVPGVWPRRHRLSIDDFHALTTARILGEDDRVELINGELIDMAPIGSPHRGAVDWIAQLLMARTGGSAIVSSQNPIALAPDSEPQPDLALLKPRADYYSSGHPTPPDILLLIEVADSTVRYDREIKIPLYAQHDIAEAWLLDLPKKQLEVFRSPSAGAYRLMLKPEATERVSPTLLPGLEFGAGDLFVPG